jgi:hypothetical protein
VLRWDLTITTGLSAKNLVIYLLATFLALRMVIGRTSVTPPGRCRVPSSCRSVTRSSPGWWLADHPVPRL